MAIKKVKLKNMSGDQLIPDVGIPSQAGNNGRVLGTNGNNLVWVNQQGSGGSSTWGSIGGTLSDQTDLQTALNEKQSTLVSGTNIKTINNESILGSGNITISGGGSPSGEIINQNTNSGAISPLKIWQGTQQEWEQGEETTWYNWQSNSSAITSGLSTLPESLQWTDVIYGSNKFIAYSTSSTTGAYSLDGLTWNTVTFPFQPYEIVYENNTFIAIENSTSSSSAAYSTDGLTWTTSSLPSSGNWETFILYGNGKFVIAKYDSDQLAYSTNNGTSWSSITLPVSRKWELGCAHNYDFVIVASAQNYTEPKVSATLLYSNDGGTNWSEAQIPDNDLVYTNLKYVKDNFILIDTVYKILYSANGRSWTSVTIEGSLMFYNISYNGNIYTMNVLSKPTIMYSTDLKNWTSVTVADSTVGITFDGPKTKLYAWVIPNFSNAIIYTLSENPNIGDFIYNNLSPHEITKVTVTGIVDENTISTSLGSNYNATRLATADSYLINDGKFICNTYTGLLYSTDGINWSFTSVDNDSQKYRVPVFGDNKYVTVGSGPDNSTPSNKSMYLLETNSACYTVDNPPTITSQIYTSPSISSSLTITSVDSNSITLSNSLTYNYNSEGNIIESQSIGALHPNYLCFINNVGVKIGDTNITPVLTTSITSTSTDAEVPSAKAVYDEVGEVETLINAL